MTEMSFLGKPFNLH